MPGWLLALISLPRLAVWVLASLHPAYRLQPDSANYLTLAKNLGLLNSFTLNASTLTPETYRVPGYPLFLAPFTFFPEHGIALIVLAQTVLGIATAYMTWRWLSTFASERGAIFGTLIMGWDPVTVLHTPIMLSDTLFLFVLTCAIYWTWTGFQHAQPASAWKAAVLWGLTPLIRPVAILIVPVLSIFWYRDKKALLIFFLIGTLLPVAWILRNTAVARYGGLSSQGGLDLLMDTTASIEALAQQIPLEDTRTQLRSELAARHPAGFATQGEQEVASRDLAFQKMVRHPFIFLRYELQGAVKILGGTGMDLLLPLFNLPAIDPGGLRPTLSGEGTRTLYQRYPFLMILQIGYWLVLLFIYTAFWVGVYRLYQAGKKAEAVFLVVGLIYFLALSSHVGAYRLRIPLMPFLAGGVAAAWSHLKFSKKSGVSRVLIAMGTRIIHLITSLEGGGTENFLYQILAHSPQGYDHQVLYLKKDGVIGERLRQKGIPVRPAGSLPALYQTLNTESPRILHTCLYSAHIIGRCLGRMAQVPAIITSQRAIDIWQKPWQTWLDRRTLSLSDGVIVNSRAAAEVIKQRRGPSDRPEIYEIPNGVDTERFTPQTSTPVRQRYGLPSDAIVGGALMRLHSEKGADFTPTFAAQLLPNHPNLHLIIGGVGPFEASLKKQTANTPYANRIHWLGWENDTPAFLSACDFYWSLSREESFPQTLVEASIMGLPWVAPRVGGVPTLSESGAVGVTFERLDISDAVQKTGLLIDSLPERSGQAKKNRPQLQAAYSLQKMLDQVYDVFRRYG